MRGCVKAAARLVWLVVVAAFIPALLPTALYAQGAIAGTVKDSSGAVLPGATVEAASPALIEKVRSAATDGTGQYRIENLRPGTYVVTFTLSGFSTVKREGIELTGSFTATVNADMKVGSVAETATSYSINGPFAIKMTLLVCAIAVQMAIHIVPGSYRGSVAGRVAACASLLCWFGIAYAGRAIAFTNLLGVQ